MSDMCRIRSQRDSSLYTGDHVRCRSAAVASFAAQVVAFAPVASGELVPGANVDLTSLWRSGPNAERRTSAVEVNAGALEFDARALALLFWEL